VQEESMGSLELEQ